MSRVRCWPLRRAINWQYAFAAAPFCWKLTNYKLPRHVLFLESLPLNASSKVLKRELVQSALALLAHTPAA